MEVSKMPPADVPAVRAGAAAPDGKGSPSTPNIAPPADHADIRPLDIPGALQILLAEVRAELDLVLDARIASSPLQAARTLVEAFLTALPQDAGDAPVWTAALVGAEAGMRAGIERAIVIVAEWRNVPVSVVDAARDTRTLVFSALGEDPLNPLWLRPEWVGLAPTFRRFWRRRRNARRRLTDPDHRAGCLDDDSEEFHR
jgi:hypothetical protein